MRYLNHHLDVDYLVVGIFLLITLVVGLRAGRGVKDFRSYAIGNKKFGTAALVLTFLATEVGGQGAINLAGEIGTVGIIVLFTFLSFSLSYLVQALWIAPKMRHFSSCLTMGDVMCTLYGRPTQVVVGTFSFIIAICCAGAEIVMLGVVSESLLGIDARWGIIAGSLLLIFYVVHGGMGAVTTTDVVQFLVLLVLLPVLAATALQQAGGIKAVLTHIPHDQLRLWHHPRFSYYLVLFVCFGVFHVTMIDPALIPRMLMAQSSLQLRRMFLTLTGLFAVIFLVFAVLGTTGHQLYPTLVAAEIIPQMIKTLLPVGLRGLMVGGIIAVVMASADSYLHAAGVTLVHDVLQPLGVYRAVFIQELRWVRYVTLLAGLLIMGLGLTHGKDLYALIFAYIEFATPLLVFPFFSGILGLKPDRRAFYGSAAVTLLTFLVGKRWLPETYSHFLVLICILASGITFFMLHLIRHRGFIILRRNAESTETADEYLWQPRRRQLGEVLQQWFPTPRRIVQYSRRQVDKYGAPYILFGAFCCINFTLPYFMWEHASRDSYNLMLYLRVWGGLACGLLIVRDKWPDALLPYLPTFWHLTLLYCLPFTSTVMFLLTKGSAEWLINVAITIMFLIVLVDWLSFVILSALGVALGFLFYQLVIGPIDLHLDFSTGYLLVYQAIFATLIGLIFARRKQLRFDRLATNNQMLLELDLINQDRLLESFKEKVRIIQTLKHAGIQNLLQVARIIKDLRIKDHDTPLSEVTSHIEFTLIPMALQLQAIEHRATDYLRLHVETCTIQTFLEQVQAQLSAQGHQQGIHYQVHTRYEELEGDTSRLVTLMVSSIAALRKKYDHTTPIWVSLEDTQLHYALSSVQTNYIKKVAALRFAVTTHAKIPPLKESYTAQMNGHPFVTPDSAQALVALENRRIVKAHYGYSSMEGDLYYCVVPVYLREVRPTDMDKPYMELGITPTRANDRYPGAQEQEQEFLNTVRQRTQAHLETVKTVLELIKWYHGPVCRQTGEPFYLHPLAVARIVLDYNQEEATILAALLHDTVEDTHMLLEHIEAVFGKETAGIVDKVTHLESGQDGFYKIKLSAEENILMLLESGDDRAMYVKIADRMHNIRTIQGKSVASQERIAKETLQFFVPQAQRLGLHEAAKELQERSVAVLVRQ
jgi:Na+/proline symporter